MVTEEILNGKLHFLYSELQQYVRHKKQLILPESGPSLIQQNSLKLVTWTILQWVYKQKKYQKGLQPLLHTPVEPVHLKATSATKW